MSQHSNREVLECGVGGVQPAPFPAPQHMPASNEPGRAWQNDLPSEEHRIGTETMERIFDQTMTTDGGGPPVILPAERREGWGWDDSTVPRIPEKPHPPRTLKDGIYEVTRAWDICLKRSGPLSREERQKNLLLNLSRMIADAERAMDLVIPVDDVLAALKEKGLL